MSLSSTADVIVIGGGVTGTSVAFHLAARGMRPTLLERGRIGDGISGTSGAIIRQHHSIPELAAMAAYSLGVYRDFENQVGGPSGFVETGYVVIVGDDYRATLEANVRALATAGIRVELVEPPELADLLPYADLDDVAGASWEPDAGYADGRLTAETFARRAADLGASIHEGIRVTSITRAGDRVTGVRTTDGDIAATSVVVAASTGAPALMSGLNYDFPVSFEREWICFYRRPWAVREPHPAGVDLQLHGHFRPDGGRTTLFGGEAPPEATRVSDPAVFERRASGEEIASSQAALTRRFPAMATAVLLGGYGCVDDVTPDWLPYLGPVEGCEGLVAAYGMSSHFFKHAPVVGRSVAEWLTEGRSTIVDLAFFRPERFAQGKPIRSPHPYGSAATL
jgi:glycine/D-amino acid oxidase-like deaminating enzyme